ncbi:MAG: hypothetical protein ACYC0V_09980, partial [Armatimonadota bacterium]
MSKFYVMILIVLALANHVEAAPSFQILTNPAQVGLYEVYQSTFQLNTVATNYSWPYDTSPPAS